MLRLSKKLKKGDDKEINDTRMRRILNCDTLEELQVILRPVLNFIISRGFIDNLCLHDFLNDLLYFEHEAAQNRIKKKWAKGFYTVNNDKEEKAKND